jgi:hypothetical protein
MVGGILAVETVVAGKYYEENLLAMIGGCR